MEIKPSYLQKTTSYGAEHVQIINFLGTIILEKHLSGQLLEEFIITQTGMYFIVISLGNHIITTKLLVTN